MCKNMQKTTIDWGNETIFDNINLIFIDVDDGIW